MTVRRPLVLVNGRIAELPLADTTAGSSGDLSYTHVQGVPSTTWNVVHGLDKYPAVVVMDSSGDIVEGEVSYTGINSLTINFSAAFSGEAYFN